MFWLNVCNLKPRRSWYCTFEDFIFIYLGQWHLNRISMLSDTFPSAEGHLSRLIPVAKLEREELGMFARGEGQFSLFNCAELGEKHF